MVVAISIVIAAIIGHKSGITTAFLEIGAGILIASLFSIHHLPDALHTLSELGIVSLMFLAGLEVDLQFIREKGKAGITIGVVAFFASLGVMLASGLLLFNLTSEQALLFAIGLSECSVGIVYPVLRKKGALGPRRKIILSAAMVMELLAIITLTIFFASVSWNAVFIVLFILALYKLFPWLQHRYHLLKRPSEESIAIKFILAMLLISSFLASSSGIDAIVVVFILGMILAHYVDEHETLQKEIETISFGFLTPIFFVSAGMGITLAQFFGNIFTIVALFSITLLTTYLAIFLTARTLLPKRAHTVSVLLNAPMAIGIITATIGLEQGIINSELYSILLGAVLLSSFVAVVFGRYPEDLPIA